MVWDANPKHEMAKEGEEFIEQEKYEEALGLLADIVFMQRAQVFIGLCMSQIGRLVVSGGESKTRVALDSQNINQRDRQKFGSDEGWISPADAVEQQKSKGGGY